MLSAKYLLSWVHSIREWGKMPEKYNKNNAIVVPIEKGISKIDVKYVKTPVQIISF